MNYEGGVMSDEGGGGMRVRTHIYNVRARERGDLSDSIKNKEPEVEAIAHVDVNK